MKELLKYLKRYKKECVLAPLFKMLEASFELIVPLVMAAIIDTGIENKDTGYILKMCGVLVLLGLVGLICSVVAQYFSAKAAVGVASGVRHSLFGHLLGLSYTEIDTLGTSTMITRMTSDVNQVQTGVNMFLRLFLRSPFVVFGAMIMAFTIDAPLATIFAIVIVALSVIVFGIMGISIPLMKKVQQGLDNVLTVTRENLAGVRVIRAFCKEEDEIASFKKKNGELLDIQKKSGGVSALMNPLTYIVINAAICLLIWKGAIKVDMGNLTQGEVVALYNYMSQILIELIKLANLIITINKALASANRIGDVMKLQPSMTYPSYEESVGGANIAANANYDGPKVEFRNVSLKYKNAALESLENIHFTVNKGETIGIIGGTGSGKSSVVNLIPRFYDVTEGEVLVDGVNVKEYEKDTLLNKIGIVLQKAVLFSGTIKDNLLWGNNDATEEEIMEAVVAAQAKDVVDSKGGLDGEVAQGGKNFSGGQRQRLTIARALVRRPEILILDDSASALDMATDANLRKAISELDYKPTVFIVSQRTVSIMNADKIVVLDDGEIVGVGKHEQLLESCGVYREIYESQA